MLLLVPVRLPTVTVIFPVVAPLGATTTNCVVVAELGVAAVVPLNLTVLLAGVVLKLVPVMVTVVLTGPLVGVKPLIVGGDTVKMPLLVPIEPPTVTLIFPVVAPLGTVTINFVVVAELGVAAVVPLNLTVLLALVVLKLVPVIVTDAPTAPLVGVKLLTVVAAQTEGIAKITRMQLRKNCKMGAIRACCAPCLMRPFTASPHSLVCCYTIVFDDGES